MEKREGGPTSNLQMGCFCVLEKPPRGPRKELSGQGVVFQKRDTRTERGEQGNGSDREKSG